MTDPPACSQCQKNSTELGVMCTQCNDQVYILRAHGWYKVKKGKNWYCVRLGEQLA